jgi:ATP-dependent helicase/nuclease subunit A
VTVITDLKNTYAAPTTDAAARARILADLDTNMLVEAGAGSGKTTSLVGRMHALVVRGEPVERIAAVTFTRKAAGELRERFQIRLEAGLRGADPDSEEWRRCDRALRELDRAFLGTIHSFCARILR